MDHDSLTALIEQVQQTTDLVDPHDLAERVAKLVYKDNLRDALALTLPDYIRVHVIHRERRALQSQQMVPQPPRRVAGKKSYYERLLASPVEIPGRGWLRYGDCDRASLLALAKQRRMLADANHAAADQHERVADLLGTVTRRWVRDLPEDALTAAWTAVA